MKRGKRDILGVVVVSARLEMRCGSLVMAGRMVCIKLWLVWLLEMLCSDDDGLEGREEGVYIFWKEGGME